MSGTRRSIRTVGLGVLMASAFAGVLWLTSGTTVRAQAPAPAADPQDIAEGMTIFRTKADCQTCHGWAADGRKMDTQMPDAPNLRLSRLGLSLIHI